MGAEAEPLSAIEGALTAAAFTDTFKRLPAAPAAAPATAGFISGGATPARLASASVRLQDLPPEALSDLLAVLIGQVVTTPAPCARLTLAADAVVHDPTTPAALAGAGSSPQALDILLTRVQQRAAADAELVGMGIPSWLAPVRERLGEALSRATDLPAYAVSAVAAELRKPLNECISTFLGDVFLYLRQRGTAAQPGEIPQRFLETLQRAQQHKLTRGGEPLVVLSHSMGGQIVYDAITHFLPGTPALHDLRIDFWCATASQVGFFEELKLFLSSSPDYKTGHPVPFPAAHLGAWWNVWDQNDSLSFTARDIMAQVDDGAYDSGMSLLAAHGGYLQRPSFYRKLASKLRTAAAQGWRTL